MDRISTLDSYRCDYVFRPDQPDIRRWILPDQRLIVHNTAAPKGKIDVLRFGSSAS